MRDLGSCLLALALLAFVAGGLGLSSGWPYLGSGCIAYGVFVLSVVVMVGARDRAGRWG